MSDFTLTAAAPPASGFAIDGLSVQLRTDVAFVSYSASAPDSDAVTRFFGDRYGLAVPAVNRLSPGTTGVCLLRSRADQVLLLAEDAGLAESVQPDRGEGLVYRTDLSDAWVFLRLSGPKVTPLLERLSSLDLAGPRFPPGSVAETMMDHVGVYVVRSASAEFLLGIPRSYAAHFIDGVESAARLLD